MHSFEMCKWGGWGIRLGHFPGHMTTDFETVSQIKHFEWFRTVWNQLYVCDCNILCNKTIE